MPKRKHEVTLTLGAKADLEALYHFTATYRSPANADALIDKLLDAIETLDELPERGSIPKELARLGVEDFRQLIVPPYRVIYQIEQTVVFVLLIADGRRDMQTLLERRLLSG
jgi:toxin ParE1/3/4